MRVGRRLIQICHLDVFHAGATMSSASTVVAVVTVALADDNLLVREGIQRMLAPALEVKVVAVCEDKESLLMAVERESPDVVLTDIRMPPSNDNDGIEIANSLRDSHPRVGVIVLSQYVDTSYVVALLQRGSARRGYLLKDSLAAGDQLVAAILEVAAGGSVIDPKVVDSLVHARAADSASPLRVLTPRELEILAEVASGKSNGAIASSLTITKGAVERHVGSIFAKLDLGDEAEVSRRVTATLLFLAHAHADAAIRHQ
jgi:DNA-binding NarL/FixJ family response regulator